MKYIIDTDPGIDDAIAIMLGIQNKLDVIGFTIATGNIEFNNAYKNLGVIQDFLNTDIKMYKGEIINKGDFSRSFQAHGKDGLGDSVFPNNPHRHLEKISAEDFIIKSSKKYKDNLTIICLGPLTNLANAIRKDKHLCKRLKHVIIMGTSYDENNLKPYLEFNVSVDPKGADLVFNANFADVKVITHEIGVKSFIEKDYIESLKDSPDLISRFLNIIAKKYIEFSYEHYGTIGLGTPDPTTIASVIDKDIVKFKPCDVKIITNGLDKGICQINLTDKSNVQVSTDLDLEKFRTLFKKTFH